MKTLTAISCLFWLTGVAHATTVLVDDNFTNSTATNQTSVSNTESSGVGTHTMINGTLGLSVQTVSFFGSSKALKMNVGSGSVDYRAFDGATTLTLNSLAANQTLSLSFNVGYQADPTASLSFGFVDNTGPNSVVYVNQSLVGASNASKFRYRTGSAFMSAASPSVAIDLTNGVWTDADTLASTSYTLQLDVTKLANGNFQLDYSRDNSLVKSLTVLSTDTWVTSVGGTAITGIAFRNESVNSANIFIDNVLVSVSAIPEPSTYALLLGGLTLGVVVLRRRAKANG